MNNPILMTDHYKACHYAMYPKGTEYVYSYFESRKGAKFAHTPFFGLHYLLSKHMNGRAFSVNDLYEAKEIFDATLGAGLFNFNGWKYISDKHDGRLPVRIKAVPEGLPIPTGNVLMTVENTDPKCWWLTNYLESLLTHVWYPSTVCALSRSIKQMIKQYNDLSGSNDLLDFKLHDFGYRGVSSNESSAIGGAAHLVNFKGTDTPTAQWLAKKYYGADLKDLAFSVPATEHSIMTSMGEDGELGIIDSLMVDYPKGILSVVADSYDIYRFVERYVGVDLKERILARDGVFVIRPDSNTPEHPTPEGQMVWIINKLWEIFGGITNDKGYKVVNPKVRVLWGDGIDKDGIEKILKSVTDAGYSTDNIACFGMGGGLLQKVNRDTQRFAFKSSAQCRNGVWHDVYKRPRDVTKESKRGKLKLILDCGTYMTVPECDPRPDVMQTVYENGEILVNPTFAEIRNRAAL